MCWNHGQCHRSDKLHEKIFEYKEHFLQLSWMKNYTRHNNTKILYYNHYGINWSQCFLWLLFAVMTIMMNSCDKSHKTICIMNTHHVCVISCFLVFKMVILIFYWKCRAILPRNEAIRNIKMLFAYVQVMCQLIMIVIPFCFHSIQSKKAKLKQFFSFHKNNTFITGTS